MKTREKQGFPQEALKRNWSSMRTEEMVAGMKGRTDTEGNENVSEGQGAGETGAEGHSQAFVSVPERIMALWIRELGNTSRMCAVVHSACET